MIDDPVLLRFEGAVRNPLEVRLTDLLGLPEENQVLDVSRFQPTRRGDAVTLAALIDRAGPNSNVTHVTLHADRDDFHVSVPLEAIRDQGLLVYKIGKAKLEPSEGGPIRMLIRDPLACHSGELDECANVKYLSRIELTIGRGRDTRPVDEAEHQALHDRQA